MLKGFKKMNFFSKKKISCFVSSILSLNIIFNGVTVFGADMTIVDIESRTLAKDITYKKQQVNYTSGGKTVLKERINVIKADFNNKDTKMVFSKAKDKTLGTRPLSSHAQDQSKKGDVVVGGVNGDFFNFKIGSTVGPHIQDGTFILGYISKSDEKRFPILTVDSNNNVAINNLSFTGLLKVSSGDSEKALSFDSINRYYEFDAIKYKAENQMMVMTPNYSDSNVITTSPYAPSEVLTVVSGITTLNNGGMKIGEEYEGTVVDLGISKSKVTIPSDGVVLACSGTKAQWVKNNVKKGDKIKLKGSLNKGDVVHALTGYNYLVKNAKPLNANEITASPVEKSLVNYRKPRTAIGLTSDNKLLAVVVEGGKAVASSSYGATLPELAQTMKDLGAVTAINLDGGGSTEMVVKKYAQYNNEIVNVPSDGSERYVANTVLFVNGASKSNKVGSMILNNEDILLYKNSSYKINIIGEDENCLPYDFKNKVLNWTTSAKDATVSADGKLTAGNSAGSLKITAECNGVKASRNINVVDKIYDFTLDIKGTIYGEKDKTYSFNVYGKNENGKNILIDKKAVNWSVQGDIGSIDKEGNLTVNVSKGKGSVTAEAGGKKVIVPVEIGIDSLIIEDFEEANNIKVDGFVGGKGVITKEQSYKGNGSLKVTYNYDEKWTREFNGTINLKPSGNLNKYSTYTMPKKVGIAVYGDGQAPWLRGVITDSLGKQYTIDFVDRIAWKDQWKEVYAEIPKEVVLPIKLNYIYMVETNKKLHYKGSVYFDDLKFIYNEEEPKSNIDIEIKDLNPKNHDSLSTGKPLINGTVLIKNYDINDLSIEIFMDEKQLYSYFYKDTGMFYAIPDFVLENGKHNLIIKIKSKDGTVIKEVNNVFNVNAT